MGSVWGQHRVNNSTWGQPRASLGINWGQTGFNVHRPAVLLSSTNSVFAFVYWCK